MFFPHLVVFTKPAELNRRLPLFAAEKIRLRDNIIIDISKGFSSIFFLRQNDCFSLLNFQCQLFSISKSKKNNNKKHQISQPLVGSHARTEPTTTRERSLASLGPAAAILQHTTPKVHIKKHHHHSLFFCFDSRCCWCGWCFSHAFVRDRLVVALLPE